MLTVAETEAQPLINANNLLRLTIHKSNADLADTDCVSYAMQLCCFAIAIPLIKACFLSRQCLSIASISVLLLRMMAFSVVSRYFF